VVRTIPRSLDLALEDIRIGYDDAPPLPATDPALAFPESPKARSAAARGSRRATATVSSDEADAFGSVLDGDVMVTDDEVAAGVGQVPKGAQALGGHRLQPGGVRWPMAGCVRSRRPARHCVRAPAVKVATVDGEGDGG
jgi:hypothetical protein